MAYGHTYYTYSRISRRQPATRSVILPARRRHVPDVAIVLDTSGSRDDGLPAQALAEIDGVLKSRGVADNCVTTLAVDRAVHGIHRVTRACDVTLGRRGRHGHGRGYWRGTCAQTPSRSASADDRRRDTLAPEAPGTLTLAVPIGRDPQGNGHPTVTSGRERPPQLWAGSRRSQGPAAMPAPRRDTRLGLLLRRICHNRFQARRTNAEVRDVDEELPTPPRGTTAHTAPPGISQPLASRIAGPLPLRSAT